MYKADTIVARATAAGRSAIAIVRLSGPDARAIADRILVGRRPFREVEPWKLARFSAVDPRGRQRIDDVLAVHMPGPRSYTGEDVVEIHCHGSTLITDTLNRIALSLGARAAAPGEFTRRAFLNDRIDLVQAEAVAELIDAPVLAGVVAAASRLEGALSGQLNAIRSSLVAALAELEAHIDFTDDDLPDESPARIVAGMEHAERELLALVDGFPATRREQQGYRVVLAGRPNVGKSSLLNALVGFERVVVSAEAGTTRDTVGELFDLDGYALCITDTAGVRDAASSAERTALEHSARAIGEADVVLRVFDASMPLRGDDEAIAALRPAGAAIVSVLNKSDLPIGIADADLARIAPDGVPVARTSALTARGIDSLRAAIAEAIASLRGPDRGATSGICRERHRAALQRTGQSLAVAIELLRADGRTELAAAELRQALRELASVTDAVDDDEILDEIFSSFCIGK